MGIRDFIDDTARSVAFLSRVPMPQRHFIGYDGRLSRAVRAFPLAGVLIVLPAAALAADPETCATVRLSDPGWTDITATNGVASAVLTGLGY